MKIRILNRKDVKNASKIVGLNYSKKYEKRVKKEIKAMFSNYVIGPKYLVAEEKGKIFGFAGYIQSWIDYHIYNIFWVNVHPEYQRKGIGILLIKKIIQILKNKKGENKAAMILLTTKSPHYYKKFGFKILQKFRKKNYLMALNL